MKTTEIRAGTDARMGRPEARRQEVYLLLLIFVIGGVFGFFYEELFYYIDLGHLIKRGSTFGPWIQIYGFGAVFIALTTKRLRRRPWLVFLVSGVVCGALEYATGFVFDRFFHIRSWDYNVEIWNWGNIGGYVCARSVLFFALSGLFLQYVIRPLLERYAHRVQPRTLALTAVVPAAVCVLDMVASTLYDTFFRG